MQYFQGLHRFLTHFKNRKNVRNLLQICLKKGIIKASSRSANQNLMLKLFLSHKNNNIG